MIKTTKRFIFPIISPKLIELKSLNRISSPGRKKGNNYIILFFELKGTEHTNAYRKIDGFSRIFEEEINGNKQSKDFSYNEFTINVKLLLNPRRGIAEVLENYKRYWFDNFVDFAEKIKALGLTEKKR